MQDSEKPSPAISKRTPWNKGKLTGAKPPLRPKHVWTIRTKLQVAGRIRDLAIFNLAIDSKLRGCDVVALKVEACSLCPSNSDINLLCYCQSIIDLDTKLLGGQRRTKVRVVLPDQRDGVITHDIRQAVDGRPRRRFAIAGAPPAQYRINNRWVCRTVTRIRSAAAKVVSRRPSSRARTSIRFSSRLLINTTPIGSAASKPHDQEEED